MERILSGIRPTRKIHLGNLVGALQNWVNLQNSGSYECFFMVADWHSLTSEYANSGEIQNYILDNVADWIGCGIDPEKSTVFVQSHVKEHAELHLLLSMITPLGWLERCPTYKEQKQEIKNRDLNTYAFLGYPVLQAADILVYRAGKVPVGEDQLPHLELAREIARRFNYFYGDVLLEPQPLLTRVPKLLGIDGRKMSKSYGNSIAVSDPPEAIREKTAAMFTDPLRVKLSDPGHPESCNVYSYFQVFKPGMAAEVEAYCRGARLGCTQCKENLAGVLIEKLSGARAKREELLRNKERLRGILADGAKKAVSAARQTMGEIRKAVGI